MQKRNFCSQFSPHSHQITKLGETLRHPTSLALLWNVKKESQIPGSLYQPVDSRPTFEKHRLKIWFKPPPAHHTKVPSHHRRWWRSKLIKQWQKKFNKGTTTLGFLPASRMPIFPGETFSCQLYSAALFCPFIFALREVGDTAGDTLITVSLLFT